MPGSKPQPPRLPASLAERYVLEERLAHGGSAEVWRARDTVLDRPVAVKVLHRHLLDDPTTRARLIQEARAAASLSHPGIVAVYDVAIDEAASAAVILELVQGESLNERIKREGALPPRAAARIAAEVAEALAHAHARGVVHRDVKAANVLLGGDGEARLADFGIARLLDDAAQRLTDTGTIAGTLRYLAPEQLRGEPAGPPADVYAVGVLLTEMLTGHPPYQVDSPVALAEAQRTPPMAIEGAPPSLSAILRPTLDPDPERRPASAEALAAELRSWLEADAAPPAPDTASDAPTLPAIPLPGVPPVVVVPPDQPAAPPPPAPVDAAPSGAAAGAAAGARSGGPRDPRRPRTRSSVGDAVGMAAIVAALLVALFLVLAAVTAPIEPGPKPSPSASPEASPSPTASPSASPSPSAAPLTISEAIEAFRDLVDRGEEDGLIDSDAAQRLLDRVDEVANAVDDGSQGDLNKAFRDLRRAIEESERDGHIGSDMVARLVDAVDEIEAAVAREGSQPSSED